MNNKMYLADITVDGETYRTSFQHGTGVYTIETIDGVMYYVMSTGDKYEMRNVREF